MPLSMQASWTAGDLGVILMGVHLDPSPEGSPTTAKPGAATTLTIKGQGLAQADAARIKIVAQGDFQSATSSSPIGNGCSANSAIEVSGTACLTGLCSPASHSRSHSSISWKNIGFRAQQQVSTYHVCFCYNDCTDNSRYSKVSSIFVPASSFFWQLVGDSDDVQTDPVGAETSSITIRLNSPTAHMKIVSRQDPCSAADHAAFTYDVPICDSSLCDYILDVNIGAMNSRYFKVCACSTSSHDAAYCGQDDDRYAAIPSSNGDLYVKFLVSSIASSMFFSEHRFQKVQTSINPHR